MADDSKSVTEELEEIKDRAVRKAATETARRTVSRVANDLLDELEELLLGHKGAAKEILTKEEGLDPLERIREAYAQQDDGEDDPGEDAARVRREQRRQRALEELERLKQARGLDSDDEADTEPPEAAVEDPAEEETRPRKATRRL